MPMPSQSVVPSYLYQARVSIPTVVIQPPKHPNLKLATPAPVSDADPDPVLAPAPAPAPAPAFSPAPTSP